MKIERTISIKNRKLLTIRNNFRKIFLYAIIDEQEILHNKERKIYFDENGIYRSSETLTELEKADLAEYQNSWWNLERLKRRSICFCSVCNKIDSDMTYLSPSIGWVCINCYQAQFKKERA